VGLTPNTFWVDLKQLNFSENAPVKMLPLMNNETYSGETSGQFIDAEPFTFLGL